MVDSFRNVGYIPFHSNSIPIAYTVLQESLSNTQIGSEDAEEHSAHGS